MKKKSKAKKIILIAVILALVAAAVFGVYKLLTKKEQQAVEEIRTEVTVERRDIVNTISGTSVIEPKDSYEITSMASGDVIFAGFEKDDYVEKDQILYRIDASDTEKSLTSAGNSLTRAQRSYNDAVEKAQDLTIVSDYTGKVSGFKLKVGDAINAGTVIARIYDDTQLDITVPFVEDDANYIYVGQSATVSVSNSATQVVGTVTEVMSTSYSSASRINYKDVTVRITNPGALTPSDTATVQVGNLYCSDTGNFEYITDKNLTSEVSGDIAALYIKEGDYITKGQRIALIENKSVTDAVENARLSLSDSQLSYENAQDRVDDYTIKAPISGTVVEKNVKVGDTFDSSKSTQGAMAIIYDMSSLKFDISIDETDISSIQAGQSVTITADAIEGKSYTGTVTNVSIVGVTSNGITSYPVTVEITEFDDELKPGMNIEAVINISSATDVIAIPIAALNRGNTVYIKGEKESENDSAPDGFKTVRVEVGVSDGSYVEIKSGLNEGDVIEMITYVAVATDEEEQTGMPAGMGGGMGGGMPMGGGMGGGGMPGGGGGMPSGGGNRSGGMR